MQDLSLHVLDIIENSIRAEASRIEVTITEDRGADRLYLIIKDDGNGMDDEGKAHCLDPFYTSKNGRRIGLGLPLLAQSAQAAGGRIEIESGPSQGTAIRAEFGLTHPDRKPLGDMERTMELLRLSHPRIEFDYQYITVQRSVR